MVYWCKKKFVEHPRLMVMHLMNGQNWKMQGKKEEEGWCCNKHYVGGNFEEQRNLQMISATSFAWKRGIYCFGSKLTVQWGNCILMFLNIVFILELLKKTALPYRWLEVSSARVHGLACGLHQGACTLSLQIASNMQVAFKRFRSQS